MSDGVKVILYVFSMMSYTIATIATVTVWFALLLAIDASPLIWIAWVGSYVMRGIGSVFKHTADADE